MDTGSLGTGSGAISLIESPGEMIWRLFPSGVAQMVSLYSHMADQAMLDRLAQAQSAEDPPHKVREIFFGPFTIAWNFCPNTRPFPGKQPCF